MAGKKGWATLLIVGALTATVSTSALADGYRGHGGGGNGFAIAAGILGAVAVGSLIANAAQPAPVYAAPPQYYPPAPAPVYYEAPRQYVAPAQVYYEAPAPRYYREQPVAYVRPYREQREYREPVGYYRDGYYYGR